MASIRQKTISKEVSFAGPGLFSGEPATLTFAPAAPDSGITFVREQDEKVSTIPALVSNVTKRPRRTCLKNGTLFVATFTGFGIPGFVREIGGEVVAYFLPGMIGHGVASRDADLLPLISLAARSLPPELARCFCPLDEPDLFRTLLAGKCRSIKTMNLMTVGPYERPIGTWLPSIAY